MGEQPLPIRWKRLHESKGRKQRLKSAAALADARRALPGRVSQAALARTAGCSPGMVGHLESGTRGQVTHQLAHNLALALASLEDPAAGKRATQARAKAILADLFEPAGRARK